jgi:spore protease
MKEGMNMIPRTDLAVERRELLGDRVPAGVRFDEIISGNVKTTVIEIISPEGERALSKPQGRYITVETDNTAGEIDEKNEALNALKESLDSLLPESGCVLVAGLGNVKITPDALGPETVDRIFATRHLGSQTEKFGLPQLRQVSAVSTGVMGQTGMETVEMLTALTEKIQPSAVIVVDALAAANTKRIGNTFQLSDVGLSPGSGVGNSRKRIDRSTLGVPVIAVGVPTVVDASSLVFSRDRNQDETIDGSLMVTPREIDRIIADVSRLLAFAINLSLQKNLSLSDLLALV